MLPFLIFWMVQYDNVSKDYSKMHSVEPIKVFAQYPTVISLLGPAKGKLFLDVGCGDGVIARVLAKNGGQVVGYDISEKQISLAKELSTAYSQLEFFVSSPKDFSYPKKFDAAYAAMVLCYLNDLSEVQALFDSVFSSLKEKGFFVLIDLDKSRVLLEKDFFSRKFHLLQSGKMELNFHVPGTKAFTVQLTGFTPNDFEDCAKKSGFRSIQWLPLEFSLEGKKQVGADFLKEYEKFSYWIVGVFQK